MQENTAHPPEQSPLASELLAAIVDSSDDAILGKDLNGIITSWNLGAQQIFGYTAQEMIGQSILRLIPVELADEEDRILDKLRAGQKVKHFETRRVSKSGQFLDVSVTASPIRDASGKIVGVSKIARDITERKQRQSRRLLGLLEGAMDAIISVDESMRVVHFNASATTIFGVSSQDAIGQSIENFIPARFRAPHKAQVEAFGKESRTTRSMGKLGQVMGLRANGEEFPAEASISHMDNEEGKIFTVILRDVTDRQRTTDAMRQSLQEKEALLKEVHHRVKNNLQVITSLLRLESRRSTQGDTRAVLGEMQGRIRSMSLLHESLYRSGRFASVDLGDYLTQLAINAFKTQLIIADSVQLRLNMGSVTVDVEQAIPCGLLTNELLSNCLKHGFPEGHMGDVTLELQPSRAHPEEWCLSVSDTGIGLPHNFEERQKTSLGLQLVTQLTSQIDGQWQVDAERMQGAKFSVTFRAMAPSLLVMPA
ncbi:sensor histidine kinase [Rhodoferax sp.]|uniref:sensor histidine kinase n=1 Tax=Rhodoferax sp. TaxID=50421 RepID=UPI001EBAE1E6|nr:PAS domain S-box protein [Rhodoferax sp.]MBT9505087.1 PAS domain S-box protein [Rhodoferax sp.]